MEERGLVALEIAPEELGYVFAPKTFSADILRLQAALNALPGVTLKVDGYAGPKTSDAYKRLTGHYLPGDPRDKAGKARAKGAAGGLASRKRKEATKAPVKRQTAVAKTSRKKAPGDVKAAAKAPAKEGRKPRGASNA
jgi:peptidoglycan hydrolase-like protein with peptidoglycan-binding domain